MEEQSKNQDFIQLYRSHIDDVAKLAGENYTAYKLLLTIIKHMDGYNALSVSNIVLQELLDVSRPTITRAVKYLKENGWVEVLKSGTSNVYIVNPDVAWTSYANQKQYCKFSATVLLSASENAEYLKNPKATNQFKSIDSEFIKEIQRKRDEYEKEVKAVVNA